MKRDEWFAFNVGHYVRDTMHLTTEQHGAYLLLILAYWPMGPLPDDDAVLASIAKQPLPAWRKMRPTLQPLFQPGDGKWNHKRIDKERMRAFALTELRTAAGAEGASKRWGKRIANATGEPSQTDRHSTNNKYKDSPSTESGSAREAACVAGAPQPRRDRSEPGKLSSFASDMVRQSLEQAAAKKF